MGRKGKNVQTPNNAYFAPSKTALRQMRDNALRSGTLINTEQAGEVDTKLLNWNAGKPSINIRRSQDGKNGLPSLLEICARFIAAQIQLYVERDDLSRGANGPRPTPPKPKSHPSDPHFSISSMVIPNASERDVTLYRGITYAHLAGTLRQLPPELRDEVFFFALRDAKLRYSQILQFIHPYLTRLDLSQYGRDFTQGFADLLLPKLGKLAAEGDSWENIDEWSVSEAYRGCPSLTYVDLSNCAIYPYKLQELLTSCQIRTLKLAHYPLHKNNLTPSTIPLSSNFLETLEIGFLDLPFEFDFPALTHLDLSYNRSGSPVTLLSVAKNSKRLAFLNISATPTISAMGFRAVLDSCPGLRVLVAKDNTLRPHDITDIGTQKSIVHMNLSGNQLIGYDAVTRIAANFEMLRSLDLTHCSIYDNSSILAHCLELRPLLEIAFSPLP